MKLKFQLQKLKHIVKKKMKSRKVILFLITLAVVSVLLVFGKDVGAIVTLYGVYAAGNVGTHYTNKIEGK